MAKSIGEKIRERRQELGMSQEELAFKAGYKSRVSINKIELERDGRSVKMSRIKPIADALNVPVDYLTGWQPDPANAKTDALLLEAASGLNDAQKERLINWCNKLAQHPTLEAITQEEAELLALFRSSDSKEMILAMLRAANQSSNQNK